MVLCSSPTDSYAVILLLLAGIISSWSSYCALLLTGGRATVGPQFSPLPTFITL